MRTWPGCPSCLTQRSCRHARAVTIIARPTASAARACGIAQVVRLIGREVARGRLAECGLAIGDPQRSRPGRLVRSHCASRVGGSSPDFARCVQGSSPDREPDVRRSSPDFAALEHGNSPDCGRGASCSLQDSAPGGNGDPPRYLSIRPHRTTCRGSTPRDTDRSGRRRRSARPRSATTD
jgi:hypothetical protein